MKNVIVFSTRKEFDMKQKGRQRATAFSKDKAARTQVAVMRMAGFSAVKISEKTGRHLKSVEAEMRKPEHFTIIRRLVAPVAKKRLPETHWKVVAKAIKEREKQINRS